MSSSLEHLGRRTVLPVLAVVCTIHSAQAHRHHSFRDDYGCLRRARGYLQAQPAWTPLEQHIHTAGSYCDRNSDSAPAEVESAARDSPRAGCCGIRDLDIRRLLLWSTLSANHAKHIDGLSGDSSWKWRFPAGDLGGKEFQICYAIVRYLVYLGKISYGLYVYDLIAISTARLLLFRGAFGVLVPGSWGSWPLSFLCILFALGLNIALAAASYRWLESPFLRLKERFARVQTREV